MDNVVEKEINGTVYRAKFRGMAFAITVSDMQLECPRLKLAEFLFREVLIYPNVTIDDFDSIESFNEVFLFLLSVTFGETPEKQKTKSQLKRQARNNWDLWRLVLANRGFDYNSVFGKPYMTPNDVKEANIALDMMLEAEKKAAKKKH